MTEQRQLLRICNNPSLKQIQEMGKHSFILNEQCKNIGTIEVDINTETDKLIVPYWWIGDYYTSTDEHNWRLVTNPGIKYILIWLVQNI